MKRKKSKLLSHLQSIHFIGDSQKEILSTHITSFTKVDRRYRKVIDLYNCPDVPKKITNVQTPIMGNFLFNTPVHPSVNYQRQLQLQQQQQQQQQPQQQLYPLVQEYMTIESKGAGKEPPYEHYHLQLKFCSNAKVFHFPVGGPQTTLHFLNQFKSLEKPATNEQLKSYNDSRNQSHIHHHHHHHHHTYRQQQPQQHSQPPQQQQLQQIQIKQSTHPSQPHQPPQSLQHQQHPHHPTHPPMSHQPPMYHTTSSQYPPTQSHHPSMMRRTNGIPMNVNSPQGMQQPLGTSSPSLQPSAPSSSVPNPTYVSQFEKDYNEALKWFKLAADQGNPYYHHFYPLCQQHIRR